MMSYTNQLKNELLAAPLKLPCCRKSLLLGFMTVRGNTDGETVSLSVESDVLAGYLSGLIREQFGRTPELMKKSGGRNTFLLRFHSKNAADMLASLGSLPLSAIGTKHCPECKKGLLRGIFLASGHVLSPEKGNHLEFSIGENREVVADFLTEIGYPPKSADRRKERLLYYKDNASVGELLSLIGIGHAAFDFINQMIENQYRSEANRHANCETRNISRAVDASLRQIARIEQLEKTGKLKLLPPDLYETALFRLEHRDLSLAQMAALMVPPITKSGLSHRFTKIMTMSDGLLADKES